MRPWLRLSPRQQLLLPHLSRLLHQLPLLLRRLLPLQLLRPRRRLRALLRLHRPHRLPALLRLLRQDAALLRLPQRRRRARRSARSLRPVQVRASCSAP